MADFNPFAKEGEVLDLSSAPPLGKFTIRGLKPGLMRQMEALGAEIEDAGEDGEDAAESTEKSVRAVCRSIEIALVGGDKSGVADALAAAYADEANQDVTFGGLMDAMAFVQASLGLQEAEAPNG